MRRKIASFSGHTTVIANPLRAMPVNFSRSLLLALPLALLPASIQAHPHVFAEARLDVQIGKNGTVESLKHLWRFDELFSSTVLVEFDANGDLELDENELKTVAETVKESIAEFNFFQTVMLDGKEVDLAPPDELIVDFQDQQMIILFEISPAKPMPLQGKLSFGVYDPTFYTAIEFTDDSHMSVTSKTPSCTRAVIRPDPDEAIAQNQQTLTEAFYQESATNDMSKMFATRLELDCKG